MVAQWPGTRDRDSARARASLQLEPRLSLCSYFKLNSAAPPPRNLWLLKRLRRRKICDDAMTPPDIHAGSLRRVARIKDI